MAWTIGVADLTDQLDRLKTALAERYTIEHKLGAGGMATAYLAHALPSAEAPARHRRMNAVVRVLKDAARRPSGRVAPRPSPGFNPGDARR